MEIEDFIKEKHPKVLDEYNRFVRNYVPSIGSKLVFLVEGLDSISGQPLEVIGYSALGSGMDTFIELKNEWTGEYYMCSFVKWHKTMKLIKGQLVSISSVKFKV